MRQEKSLKANNETYGNIPLSRTLALVGFSGREIRWYQRYPDITLSSRIRLTGGISQAVDSDLLGVLLVFLRF